MEQVGGGTGYNIEKMGDYVDVQEFFQAVYLVDLSTSLCEVARKRFEALRWTNVRVICEDARAFQFSHYEEVRTPKAIEKSTYPDGSSVGEQEGADLITMSYALSMIPEFYPVIDSLTSLLSVNGIIGVVDFYVQSEIDFQSRNYTGGVLDRHCTWLSRTFWRTWFELDRVNLEAARRVWTYQNILLSRAWLTSTGLSRIPIRYNFDCERAQPRLWSPHSVLHLDGML